MENKNITTNIDCYLELYQKEINLLQQKALALYEDFSSKSMQYWKENPRHLSDINRKIIKIQCHEKALCECKNESIANI